MKVELNKFYPSADSCLSEDEERRFVALHSGLGALVLQIAKEAWDLLGCPVKAGSTFTGLLRTWQTRSLRVSTFAVNITYCSLLEAEISTQ